jgi:hypothetical protein
MTKRLMPGVLCEVVSSVAECEKEGMLIQYSTSCFEEIWHRLDDSGDGKLSKGEFASILHDKAAWTALTEMDVDPLSLYNLQDQIFSNAETGEERDLTLDEFMEVILTFRGSNKATVKDMNDLRKGLDGTMKKLLDKQELSVKRTINKLEKHLTAVLETPPSLNAQPSSLDISNGRTVEHDIKSRVCFPACQPLERDSSWPPPPEAAPPELPVKPGAAAEAPHENAATPVVQETVALPLAVPEPEMPQSAVESNSEEGLIPQPSSQRGISPPLPAKLLDKGCWQLHS